MKGSRLRVKVETDDEKGARDVAIVLTGQGIGLEAGPLSQWLYAGMREARLSVELLETRHVRDAFKAMTVKTDRTDARGIAQLMRLRWFRSVHCKSLPAQELRAILTARKLVQSRRHDLEMSLRGVSIARLRVEGRADHTAQLRSSCA
jgi:transposase